MAKKNKKFDSIVSDAKPEKITTLKGIIDKKSPPSYIKIDGHIYERLEIKTSPIGLDLSEDVLSIVSERMKDGGYVNHQEVIREAIRALIKK